MAQQEAASNLVPLVPAEEVGAQNGISGETIRRLWREGRVPGYKAGRALRFDPVEVREAFRSTPGTKPAPAIVGPDFDALEVGP